MSPATGAEAIPLGPRPYALTGGRTEGQLPLAIEALVTTVRVHAAPGAVAGLGPEHRGILGRCTVPTSVAEVSAVLDVPLGVARVLVSDLAVQGFVTINQPADGQPTAALMERVLGGLRRL
ncbi:DUF742 domain-containing protein [Streptomyces sp. NPDC059009]|uniref:DUF742 domain-containing protein n=1 Tax=Streptomyces sp. NPDC059009 TaxID=3346694 RepID=UPI0036B8F6B4